MDFEQLLADQKIRSELDFCLKSNSKFAKEALVLFRNENSDLLYAAKESSRDFFERVFSLQGPFWKVYSETKTGIIPRDCEYLNFIAGRMYFCQNIEKKYLQVAGPEKELYFKDGELLEKNKTDLKNALYLVASPITLFSNALELSLLPIFVEEKMRSFLEFKKLSLKFYHDNQGSFSDYMDIGRKAMDGAVAGMEFSFVASLAAGFKAPLANSDAHLACEAELFQNMLSENLEKEATMQFGFLSDAPYDISKERLGGAPKLAMKLKQPFPKGKYARFRENAKFLSLRYLSILREVYLETAKITGMGGEIFHLRLFELSDALKDPARLLEIAKSRQAEYEKQLDLDLPSRLIYFDRKWQEEKTKQEIAGTPAGAQTAAEGEIVFVNSEKDYSKKTRGKIIFSKTFSPNLASLLLGSVGIVSETGGVLAHAAIIARELSLPCIVQLKSASALIEGQKVHLDGKTGKVTLLS